MIKKTLLFASLVLALPASAFVSSAGPAVVRTGASSLVVQYAKNGTPLAVGQRSIAAGATSGEALIRDMLSAAGPAGNLPLTVSRAVTAAQVAAGVASILRATTPIGLTLTAAEMLSGAGLRLDNGGEIDLGVTATDRIFTEYWIDSKAGKMPSKSQACTRYAEWMYSYGHAGSAYSADGRVERYKLNGFLVADPYWGDRCQVDKTDPFTGQLFPKFRYEGIAQQSTAQKGCIESATGAVSKARADGMCPTGRYESVQAVPQAQLEAAVLPVVKTDVATALKNLIDSGGVAESSPMSISGPQSQTSAPSVSTKTSPAGTVTSTTTNNYQYNYAGDTINYTVNQTTVTQTTAPDGTTETTTETSDKTPEKTNCELYPKSIGCMELGGPEESEIPEREEELELSPEDVALPSGCPSDLALPGGRVISYASACDAAQKMRPLVIAAGVLSALLIAVAAIRGHG